MEYNKFRILANWATGEDVGLSSRFMCRIALGLEMNFISTPSDPSDFGRCYRMTMLLSEQDRKEMFDKLKTVSLHWKTIVENWAELEALYNEECVNTQWSAPKLYGRMKQLGL